jgi:RNA polymerase sigma-70 factor (ECF subfamily)
VDEDIRTYLDARRYREAFELLLDRYQHKVFRLAYSMLGDEASAEETAQDTFLRIWKALPSYRGDASLSTWIYAITRNCCLTRRKKLDERQTVSIEEPGVRAAVDSRLASKPERRQSLPDSALLLAQLSPPYREALRLFYLEEKSYEEVAAMLGLPVGTVKTNLHRARKQLAGSLTRAAKVMS